MPIETVVKDAPPTDEAILAKTAKGEELTVADKEHIKGTPKIESVMAEEGTEEKNEVEKKEEVKKEPEAKQTLADRQAVIEAELNKPEAEQDLTKFSESEVGTYWDLRKQRARNSRLQEENEVLKVQLVQKELKEKAAKEEEEEDPLTKVDDEDVITGKKLKEILAKKAAKEPAPKKDQDIVLTPEKTKLMEIEADAEFKSKGITDYYDVTQYTTFALHDDIEGQEIIRQAARKGQNVAKLVYSMIKGSKRWNIIKLAIDQEKAKLEKKEENKDSLKDNIERGERLKKNDEKIKTTGGGGAGDAEIGEITREDVQNMTIDDIRKLDKKTRELILKKYGSAPNQQG